MAKFDFEFVGKIGSMALIRKQDNDIDYNIFSRLGAELRPGMIWVRPKAPTGDRAPMENRLSCQIRACSM